MINEKKVLAVIPARGGSKGVPQKNIKSLAGKPLVAWTIEEAMKSRYLDNVILSSDDDKIIAIAKQWGCEVPYKRPERLAMDDTPGILPILHAIEKLPGYDYVVVLQPTSPLRITEDIDRCLEMIQTTKAPSVVSVTEVEKSPYWMFQFGEGSKLAPLMGNTGGYRRQDLPKVYALNGAVYVGEITRLIESKSFLTDETVGYVMPSNRSLDIDSLLDFQICEFLMVADKIDH